MGLYLGSEKLKINMNNSKVCLNLFSSTSIVNNKFLMSSDNYVLKDSNGVYLTVKENE